MLCSQGGISTAWLQKRFYDFCVFRDGRNYTGNFAIDEAVLREEGMTNFDQYACVPGTKEFMPDFFLDAYDDYTEGHKKIVEAQNAPEGTVQSVFTKMTKLINEEMVGKMKAVYAFDISGTNHPKAGQIGF